LIPKHCDRWRFCYQRTFEFILGRALGVVGSRELEFLRIFADEKDTIIFDLKQDILALENKVVYFPQSHSYFHF
jgi:hypothetical protein